MPFGTLCILSVTATFTSLQFVFPPILNAFERAPGALADGQWWRLISPLLVHPDGWKQIVFNFSTILVVGTSVEAIFGVRGLFTLYLICGVVGEIAGFAWQPSGAGASVGGAGLLGALAVRLLLTSVQGKIGGGLLLIAASMLCLGRDIHGPPLLVGALIGSAIFRRHTRTL